MEVTGQRFLLQILFSNFLQRFCTKCYLTIKTSQNTEDIEQGRSGINSALQKG